MVPRVHDPSVRMQTYKSVISSLCPGVTFFELTIIDILKSNEWGLEKSELPWKQFFKTVGVFLLEILACQFQWSVLQIGQVSSIMYLV